MIVRVSPSRIGGGIHMPPSKSSMQRACAAALLTPAKTVIKNAGFSNDEKAATAIIEGLGARVMRENGQLTVNSSKNIFSTSCGERKLSCGESGLSMRMFAPVASLFPFEVTFTGEGSILSRPMSFFDDILPKLGVQVSSNGGLLPLHLQGPLQPVDISVDGSLSSQFLTGLLFAYAHAAKQTVTITAKDLKSKPYIDLTFDVLAKFGFSVQNENYERFVVSPRSFVPDNGFEYKVEGDWSNAAFLLVAGTLAGQISLQEADLGSPQGDKKILEALKAAGAELTFSADGIHAAQAALRGFDFDATHCPDLFPPLVALATNCTGTTTLHGVERLLHKESNRAETLKQEFSKLGANIDYQGDVMQIEGGKQLMGGEVSSHNDHRIAMAAAVAATCAAGDVLISGAEAVNKSYPQFYEDLGKLGGIVEIRS